MQGMATQFFMNFMGPLYTNIYMLNKLLNNSYNLSILQVNPRNSHMSQLIFEKLTFHENWPLKS